MLVPRVFRPWADRLLDLLDLKPGLSVLDVATGPGTVARLVAQRVGPSGRVVALDANETMLEVARRKRRPPGSAVIDYRASPAAPLDIPDESFDVAVCQHGLQFFPDCQAALAELRRVLRPGGRLAVATWAQNGPIPLDGLGQKFAEFGVSSQVPPKFARTPSELVRELVAAGFINAHAEQQTMDINWSGGVQRFLDEIVPATVGPLLAQLTTEQREQALAVVLAEVEPYVRTREVVYPSVANIATAVR